MQPLCQISKILYGKSIIWVRRTEPKPAKRNICHVAQSTLVRNSIINIHLPLMIFIRMHSQESQFHDKCLICSIMSIIYVQIASFVSAFCKQIQTRVQVQPNGGWKVQKVILQVVETCQTKYRIGMLSLACPMYVALYAMSCLSYVAIVYIVIVFNNLPRDWVEN